MFIRKWESIIIFRESHVERWKLYSVTAFVCNYATRYTVSCNYLLQVPFLGIFLNLYISSCMSVFCTFYMVSLCVMVFKGTNGRQKTYEIFDVYCIFYSGFRCQTTVIFGITKDGSLVSNTLASWNCFTCRNLFQNGANDMSECLTCETAFCKKAQNFV